MTNPTTPFSWQMPTASDLVTDLPADFETFGQAVATSMADLLGGTTGQILSKASNTDMDFTWITNDVGDITAVTASAPLTGGGTSGAITVGIQDGTTTQKGAVQLENSTSSTSTTTAAVPASVKSAYDLANGAIPKSLIDAAGDLIVGTAADTAGRLAIGTAGQVLKVNSGATGLEWGTAGGGGGKVLQVVMGTTSTDTSITSTSLTDSGLSASITPSATTSKILVLVTQQVQYQRISAGNIGIGYAILRGGTTIVNQPTNFVYADYNNTTYIVNRTMIAHNYLDSPSTTSSVTYKTQGCLNATGSSQNLSFQQNSANSTIILIEIGA